MRARLPGHLQLDRHRRGRTRRSAAGRSRAPVHARRAVQQGERLSGLRRVAGSPAVSDAAPRSQGTRRARAHLLGGGARRDRRAARRHDPGIRPRGHLALPRQRQHGAHPRRVQRGPPAVERARGLTAPDDDLHDRRRGRHRLHARRQPGGDGPGDAALLETHHPVGQQHPDHEPSPVALHHHGPPAGCPPGGDRPEPDPDRRCRGRPPGAHSRDRCRAGAGPHEHRARRRRGGQGLHQPSTRSAGSRSAFASSSIRRSGSPGSAAFRRRPSSIWGNASRIPDPPGSG